MIDIVCEALLPGGRIASRSWAPSGTVTRSASLGAVDGERDLAAGRRDQLLEARGVGWVDQHDRHVRVCAPELADERRQRIDGERGQGTEVEATGVEPGDRFDRRPSGLDVAHGPAGPARRVPRPPR